MTNIYQNTFSKTCFVFWKNNENIILVDGQHLIDTKSEQIHFPCTNWPTDGDIEAKTEEQIKTDGQIIGLKKKKYGMKRKKKNDNLGKTDLKEIYSQFWDEKSGWIL